jgi:hypothetical protein
MIDKKMVVVDQDVLEKIDSHRGILGRVEFVTRCVKATLADMETEPDITEPRAARRVVVRPEVTRPEAPASPDYVTKEEFAEFRKNMESLQREFLNFFTTYGKHLLGESLSEEEMKRFSAEFRRLLEL